MPVCVYVYWGKFSWLSLEESSWHHLPLNSFRQSFSLWWIRLPELLKVNKYDFAITKLKVTRLQVLVDVLKKIVKLLYRILGKPLRDHNSLKSFVWFIGTDPNKLHFSGWVQIYMVWTNICYLVCIFFLYMSGMCPPRIKVTLYVCVIIWASMQVLYCIVCHSVVQSRNDKCSVPKETQLWLIHDKSHGTRTGLFYFFIFFFPTQGELYFKDCKFLTGSNQPIYYVQYMVTFKVLKHGWCFVTCRKESGKHSNLLLNTPVMIIVPIHWLKEVWILDCLVIEMCLRKPIELDWM